MRNLMQLVSDRLQRFRHLSGPEKLSPLLRLTKSLTFRQRRLSPEPLEA